MTFLRFSSLIRYLPCTNSVYCEYDQICKHANIQSVLGYSDKPFISAVKTMIDRSLNIMMSTHVTCHTCLTLQNLFDLCFKENLPSVTFPRIHASPISTHSVFLLFSPLYFSYRTSFVITDTFLT